MFVPFLCVKHFIIKKVINRQKLNTMKAQRKETLLWHCMEKGHLNWTSTYWVGLAHVSRVRDVCASVEGAEPRLWERHYTFHSNPARSPSLRVTGFGSSIIDLASLLRQRGGALGGPGWLGTLESAGILCGSSLRLCGGEGCACLLLKGRLAGIWKTVFTSMNNDWKSALEFWEQWWGLAASQNPVTGPQQGISTLLNRTKPAVVQRDQGTAEDQTVQFQAAVALGLDNPKFLILPQAKETSQTLSWTWASAAYPTLLLVPMGTCMVSLLPCSHWLFNSEDLGWHKEPGPL